MNMIKILAFKNKPPAPVELMPRDYASVQQTKPVKLRRHIPQILFTLLNHVTIRLCGFMQGIARLTFIALRNENLNRKVLTFAGPRAWTAQEGIARLTFIALRNENLNRKVLTFAGLRAWIAQEVITLCERLAGQDANVMT